MGDHIYIHGSEGQQGAPEDVRDKLPLPSRQQDGTASARILNQVPCLLV